MNATVMACRRATSVEAQSPARRYIRAEGDSAGEIKHGPIALIDGSVPVIVIAPHDRVFERTLSNMQEVAARGGKIILITVCRNGNANNCDRQNTAKCLGFCRFLRTNVKYHYLHKLAGVLMRCPPPDSRKLHERRATGKGLFP
jgi:fructoselysine-6-P-deglycase FrlB-like protein